MEKYDELPDLKMTALAILFQTKWRCPAANRPNDFVVKEALVNVASKLRDDDIGYLYDPARPNDLCTDPGELVGKIANSKLPYGFNFSQGVQRLMAILKAVDEEDYNRVGVVVSDCLTSTDADQLMQTLSTLKGVRYFVFGIGGCAVTEGIVHLQDALELGDSLKSLIA